jgi:hypothetical protein
VRSYWLLDQNVLHVSEASSGVRLAYREGLRRHGEARWLRTADNLFLGIMLVDRLITTTRSTSSSR